MMRGDGDLAEFFGMPRIEGYLVWRGRVLLHARFNGSPAQAREQSRPWHVVAFDAVELIRKAETPAAVREGGWVPR